MLAARLGDPLWLLARQLHLGELLGENAGVLITAELRLAIHRLTHVTSGVAEAWPTDMATDRLDAAAPLEAVVEAGTRSAPWTLWQRADAGRMFVEMARNAGLPALVQAAVTEYPLQLGQPEDPDAAALRRLMSSLPDGGALFAPLDGLDLDDPDTPLPAPFDAAAEADAVRAVLASWRSWCLESRPATSKSGAWVESQLTHHFQIAAATSEGTTVFAAHHPGGSIDWYRFDHVRTEAALPDAPEPEHQTLPRLQPSLLRYPGMPSERFWEADDHVVDLGAVDAGAADLARLLVLDYAISYGGDAYCVSVRLPAASWTVVKRLEVVDDFGARRVLRAAATPDWALFTVGEQPGLLLPPGAMAPLDSEVLDEVRLTRDEPANLAWLCEERWEGAAGRPVERPSPAAPIAEVPADPTVDLVWRLIDAPPPNWTPLLAENDPVIGPALVRLNLAGSPLRSQLAAAVASRLPDSIVRQQGRRLRRRCRLAHCTDGRPVLWTAIVADADRQQGGSGLRWDRADVHRGRS